MKLLLARREKLVIRRATHQEEEIQIQEIRFLLVIARHHFPSVIPRESMSRLVWASRTTNMTQVVTVLESMIVR